MGWASRANPASRDYRGDQKPPLVQVRQRTTAAERKQVERERHRYLALQGEVTPEGEKRYRLVDGARKLKDGTVRYFRKLVRVQAPKRAK